jgi:hypothetical protein
MIIDEIRDVVVAFVASNETGYCLLDLLLFWG